MNWLRKRKVSPLPIPSTPMMLASVLLDRVQQGEIENAVVCWKTKQGRYSISYSTLDTSDILMHEKSMQCLAMELFKE